jgi:hypothetical protein
LVRATILSLSLLIAAIVGVSVAPWLVSSRGVPGPSMLHAQSPTEAVLAVVILFGLLTTLGAAAARYIGVSSGFLILGFGLFALAWRLEGVRELLLSGSDVHLLVVEAGMIAVLLLGAGWAMCAAGGEVEDQPVPNATRCSSASVGWGIMLAASILPVVWLLARSPMKGQLIGAAFVGGVAVAFLARRFRPDVQLFILIAAPSAVAALGYVLALVWSGSDLHVQFIRQSLSPLLLPMPFEYAAGTVLGVALGLRWTEPAAEPGG